MQDDLDALKRSVDMVAMLTNYGVELKQKGNEYHGLCIWHDEKTPSMQVYVDKRDGHQRAHCKSCGKGGTVIDVVKVMDCCDEGEAIKRLRVNGYHRDDNRIKAEAPIKPNVWQHQPAPQDMPDMAHRDYGDPVATWRYNDAEGRSLGYVARYIKPDGSKDYRPWTFGSYSINKLPTWAMRAWTFGRRPLYGLDLLAQHPEAGVVISEGEKCADAARQYWGKRVSVAWPGGANSIAGVDWSPLAGRDVLLIPDADVSGVGEAAMKRVASYLLPLGCIVKILDTSDKPNKWDVADALAEGISKAELMAWASTRVSALGSRELEQQRLEEEKKTMHSVQSAQSAASDPRQFPEDMADWSIYDLPPLPDDMPTTTTLIEGEAIEIPDTPPANVVPIKPHTGIKETTEYNPTDPAQYFSHSNLARLWVEKNQDWIYCNTRQKWLQWDGSRWKLDNRKGINWAVTQEMKRAGTWIESMSLSVKDRRALANIANIKSVMEAASCIPGVGRVETDFDSDPWTLGTPGGTVDLKSGELREPLREDYISKQTEVAPQAGPMPYWDMILDRCSMGNPEMRRYYQKWAGYTLSGDASVEGFLVIHGAQNSGKGKFVSTLLEIMGEYAISFQVQLLMENKYGAAAHDVAMFSGARMASTTESTSGHRWNEGLVKALTGRDRQMACRKYENPFQFEPVAKIWMSCNEKPQLTSADGMERRLHVCEFPGTIPEPDRILDLPEKLKAEYPAILAWAIEGCLLWQREGLSRPDPVRAAVAEYIDTQDVIADWLGEKTEKCDEWIRQTDLYRSYNEFAKAAGQGALGSVRLGPELKKRGYTQKRSNGVWKWYGLRLADKLDHVETWSGQF